MGPRPPRPAPEGEHAMTPQSFVERLRQERAVAILRTAHAEAGAPALEAALRGGFRVLEVTLGTPGALGLIETFAGREEIVVGAGTVLTVAEAREAVRAGARFLVSPVTDPEVIAEAAALGVASVPGAHTPGEMLAAHRAGAPLVKLFPAPADLPGYVRQVLGPLPFLKLVPTAGVDAGNARQVLEAGAWAVGGVSFLFPAEALAAGRFDEVEARARALLTAARAAAR